MLSLLPNEILSFRRQIGQLKDMSITWAEVKMIPCLIADFTVCQKWLHRYNTQVTKKEEGFTHD